MIVTNQLLKNTNIILFLNKIDIFRTKLASGIKLKDFVVSYAERKNDVDTATACTPPQSSIGLSSLTVIWDRFEKEVWYVKRRLGWRDARPSLAKFLLPAFRWYNARSIIGTPSVLLPFHHSHGQYLLDGTYTFAFSSRV